jgi:hypothetical protein
MMEVPRDHLKLRDDPKVVSPPYLAQPLYQCATAVTVLGYVPQAKLDVEVAGVVVVNGIPGGFPLPQGVSIHLPATLVANQKVRVRQHTPGGAVSNWSVPVTVGDHTKDFPTGPPRPEINPAPVYDCGERTGVANLLVGSNVWITANGVKVGSVQGAQKQQGVNVAPPYVTGQNVRAWSELCNDPSPPSVNQVAQPPPLPLAAPGFDAVYEGSTQITVTGVVNGGHFTLSRNGIAIGTFLTWGQRHLVGVNPPCTQLDKFRAVQWLCPGDPPSQPGQTGVQPCANVPAPQIGPVQVGDDRITVVSSVPSAVIQVYVNGTKTGEGGGPVVILTAPIKHGDVIDVVQNVGTCHGRLAQEIKALCVAPPVTYDPSALDLFPVGTHEYNGGPITVASGFKYTIKGSVFYPAEDDGVNKPFNKRVAQHGRAPIAFLVHGRHSAGSPSYRGYDYFQQQLARMGIIAVSVDENETQDGDEEGWTTNIVNRADLAIGSIKFFEGLDSGGDPIFGGRIDFTKTGLMGHSRGAEAVIVIPERIALAGVQIRAVLSLAPVNSGASSGKPKGYAFMTILPAADGDVIDNNGAQFYDQAATDPFRAQLYVFHANHNYFNRQWLNDDTSGGLPLMSRPDHERVLSAYGCALFRNVLLGHTTLGFLEGTMLPAGVLTENVHPAFEAKETVIDNFDGHPVNVNSMGKPNAQLAGLAAGDFTFHQGGGSFNSSFFGETTGLVAGINATAGEFRAQLDAPHDLHNRQVWLRAAEIYTGAIPPNSTGFSVGLEDGNGTVGWVDVDDVGGLPRPFDRKAYDMAAWYHRDKTKTMLVTLRFPANCFAATQQRLSLKDVRAVRLRLDRNDKRALAFDDLEIAIV